MPFKSEAQKRKFASLVSQGKMSQATYNEWEKETPAKIPERVGDKKQANVRSIEDIKSEYKRRFGT